MPPLHLRQEFPTLKAFKEALHAWAIEAHFEPRILKSDTGRVRVGCKRDPNCPFVIRCNWERKGGREPLARVTVMKDKHTCLNGVEWLNAAAQQGAMIVTPQGPNGTNGGPGVNGVMNNTIEIRQDEDGNIVGGARVLGPVDSRSTSAPQMLPVLPKVQRNSASRLPFLMDILPRLMNITKETTPVEIRECLLREYSAEVHLQQCRRAKLEILKKMAQEEEEQGQQPQQAQAQQVQVQQVQVQQVQVQQGQVQQGQVQQGQVQQGQVQQGQVQQPDMRQQQSLDGMGSENAGDAVFGDMNVSRTPQQSPHPFTLHAATGVVTPALPSQSGAPLRTLAEAPVRCPYCINHRWMKSIKDAVEHMSMHVVV